VLVAATRGQEGRTLPAPSGRSRRGIVPPAIAVAVIVVAELLVRIFAAHLAAPVTWSTPEAQVKAAQMRAVGSHGGSGGVVFLSSSVLDVGVDPATFAKAAGATVPVYNGSLSGANMTMLRWWADRVVLPALRPRLVVIGLSSREVNAKDPQAQAVAKQFFASPAVRELNGTETAVQKAERYVGDVSDLFRYRASIRSPSQVLHQHAPIQVQKRFFTAPGGQEMALARQSFRTDEDALFRTSFVKDWSVSRAELGTLAALIGDLTARGIKVVLVDVPVTQDYINLHPDGEADYTTYRDALASVAARAGIPYLQGSAWSTTDFADPLHLNQRGAQRLSTELSVRLRSELREAHLTGA
jgi:hypothetical protein